MTREPDRFEAALREARGWIDKHKCCTEERTALVARIDEALDEGPHLRASVVPETPPHDAQAAHRSRSSIDWMEQYDAAEALLRECEAAIREAVEDGSWSCKPTILAKLAARHTLSAPAAASGEEGT